MRKLNKLKFFVGLIIIPILVLLGLFLLLGDNLEVIRRSLEGNQSADEIRSILSELGIRGKLTISILAMLQVVMMFLPAEPIQVLGGLSFGFSAGLLYCLIGVFAGNTLIFLLYKFYGERLRNFFDKELNIDLECAGRSIRLLIAVFMLYLLPAIPYGMIAFLAAGAGMKYLRFICITTLGALPSICLGVGFGHIALESSLLVTFIVFLALAAILVIAVINREKLIAAVNEYLKEGKRKNLAVREYKSRKLNLPYFIFRLLVFGKVKFKVVRTVENIERPCIVLCNHGAFIDFAYAGTVLKKESPNFIVNRMYFYEKYFGELLRSFGCFPKSIFAADTDSAMNCIRVIKRGGVLAMMPEARLSTVGRFEDIQDSTFDFLKKMGVTVYAIKIGGDYLAKPKWGTGLRRGSLVEAEMSLLFTPDELSALSVSEIEERTKNALYYNELEWLEKHPEINYRSKKMAEGLENILTRCPKCGARYSLKTRGEALVL